MIKYFILILIQFAFYNMLSYEREYYTPSCYISNITYEKNNNIENKTKNSKDKISEQKKSNYLDCIKYLIIFLIVIYIPIYYNYRQLKKWRQSVRNKDQLIISMEQNIESIKEKLQLTQISSNEIFRIYILMVRLSISPQKNRYQKFLLDYNSFIYDNDEEFRFEWTEFRLLLNNNCNNYINNLESLFPNLSDKEIQAISMQKAGFDIPDIANISGYSVNTIYKRNSDIRRKLGIMELGNIIQFIDLKFAGNQ